MNQESAGNQGAALVLAYEDLRRQALDGIRSEGLGMAVLMGQGMAAWIKVCSATLPVPAAQGYSPPAARMALLPDLQEEVVRILACMALGQTYCKSV